VPGPNGKPYCRPASAGFGGTPYRLHGGGHAHGGG
jgi:hypothetical protein